MWHGLLFATSCVATEILKSLAVLFLLLIGIMSIILVYLLWSYAKQQTFVMSSFAFLAEHFQKLFKGTVFHLL